MDATRGWLAGLALSLGACGGQPPSPYFEDARFLRFGVDPRVEADAVESQLRRAGYRVTDQSEGPHHVALGLHDEAQGRSAVRVVTGRGTVLSLDSDAALIAQRQYTLLTSQRLGNLALPRDEVFVTVTGEVAELSCVAAFRVASEGTLARIVIDANAVIVNGCASEVVDVNDDGAIELVVQAAYTSFASDDPPMLRVPLSAQGGGYRLVMGVGPILMLLREQHAQAQRALNEARHALDVERAYRRAVELAAVSRFEGASVGDQLKTFDAALRGLVLTGRQAAMLEHARQLIRQGWSDVVAEPQPELPTQAPAAGANEPDAVSPTNEPSTPAEATTTDAAPVTDDVTPQDAAPTDTVDTQAAPVAP